MAILSANRGMKWLRPAKPLYKIRRVTCLKSQNSPELSGINWRKTAAQNGYTPSNYLYYLFVFVFISFCYFYLFISLNSLIYLFFCFL